MVADLLHYTPIQTPRAESNCSRPSHREPQGRGTMSDLTPSTITKILNWAYDKALAGLPGTPTARELGESYLQKYTDPSLAIDRLVSWQISKCAAAGFVTGLGGLITLPVGLPADLTATFYINIRMVAAIAHIHGHDLHDDETRTAVFLCLIGDAAGEVLSQAGVELTTKLVATQLSKMPVEMLMKINRLIGLRLATRLGERGAVNLAKVAPIIGGLVGGAVNALTCKAIAAFAKKKLGT